LAAYDGAFLRDYYHFLVPKNKEEEAAAADEDVAQSSSAPFPVHEKITAPEYTAPPPPPRPLPTATTTYHPILPRQERRWSRRVTMDREEPPQHKLLKKRKILL
jgi:hypothetical protein